jgi:hypothetical protein
MKINLKKIKIPEEYILSLGETLLIVLLTTLPSIFVGLKVLFDNDSSGFLDLYKSGAFFLYGVSFLGSSYLVYSHHKPNQGHWFDFFGSIIIILILLFSIAYTVILNLVNPNYPMIKLISIVSLVISIPLFYYSQVINNKNKSFDVGVVRRGEQKTIENALN